MGRGAMVGRRAGRTGGGSPDREVRAGALEGDGACTARMHENEREGAYEKE